MRDRLIELLQPSIADVIENRKGITELADYLLANGVIVPPYKVNDTVYVIADGLYWQVKVLSVWYRFSNYYEDDIVCVEYNDGEIKSFDGKEIYFTKEKAKQALKGGAE